MDARNEPLPADTPEAMLRDHRDTWHSFMRYAAGGAVIVAILLLAMRLFLV